MSLFAWSLPAVEEPVTDEQLPSLDAPDSGENHLHIYERGVKDAICGAKTRSKRHQRTCGRTLWLRGQKACADCGMPICPTCFSMAESYCRSKIRP